MLNKEWLECPNILFRRSHFPVYRRGYSGELPSRDVIRQWELQLRVASVVRHHFRPPQQRFGEILAETGSWDLRLKRKSGDP